MTAKGVKVAGGGRRAHPFALVSHPLLPLLHIKIGNGHSAIDLRSIPAKKGFTKAVERDTITDMESDAYVKSIIAKYALAGGRTPSATASAESVYEILKVWAGQFLLGVSYSGSSAKGTAIAGTADVDLFISLKPETPGTLAAIMNSLIRANPWWRVASKVKVQVFGGVLEPTSGCSGHRRNGWETAVQYIPPAPRGRLWSRQLGAALPPSL